MEIEMERVNFLRESKKKVGEIYPVLVDKKGNVIDGRHRITADPNWHKKVIDADEYKAALVCGHTNWLRWRAEQKTQFLRELGELTEWRTATPYAKELGVTEKTIREYLPQEYKDQAHVESAEAGVEIRAQGVRDEESGLVVSEELPSGAISTIIEGDVMVDAKTKKAIEQDAKEIAEAVIQSAERLAKNPPWKTSPKAKEIRNELKLGILVKMINDGEIYCPEHKKSELIWKCCKKPVEEAYQLLKSKNLKPHVPKKQGGVKHG